MLGNLYNRFLKYCLFLIAALLPALAFCQYGVTCSIIDEQGNPEEYATYRIFELPDSTRLIVGNVTSTDGKIQETLPHPGNYKLMISAMMKSPITIDFTVDADAPFANLGIVNTELAGETLDEVTVTAMRPLVTKEIDRIGYDVQADGDAATYNLRDILKKVPLVSVDEAGNIKVNGSDNFKIYRNGRPNNAFTKNAKDLFAAIPASTIKKIEVITDPGAREDAESSGLILNIITVSSTSMSGFTGNISATYQSNFGPQLNAFFMTQLKKLTLSASGGYFKYLWRNSYSEETSKIKYDETGDDLNSYSNYGISNQGGWFNLETSFEADSLNLLTASLNTFISRNSARINSNYSMFDAPGNMLFSYDESSYYRKYGYTDVDFNFDYQRSTRLKGETITLSYRLSHTQQVQDQTSDYNILFGRPFNYTAIISDFDLKFYEHTFQIDWARPLGEHFKLDTGAKYILRSSHSENHQNLVGVGSTYDDFKHTYNIFGIYADARASYGKITARAGLRYEYSRLAADFLTGNQDNFHASLNDVVPNASLSWSVNDASMWKLSYNRKISRPGISYLNPAVSIDPISVSFGNPDLKSSTFDNFILNYSLLKRKINLDLSLSYRLSDNGIGSVQWTEDNVTYTTYGNNTHTQGVALALYFQWQIGEKTSWMLNGNMAWDKFSLKFDEKDLRLARFNGYFYTQLQQKLPWELTLSLGANYFSGNINSPFAYSLNKASAIGYSIGLRRSFLKNRNLDVSLSVRNLGIKDTKLVRTYLNSGKSGEKVDITHHNQCLSASISWRFGNLRAMVKKADKTITNDDLQGRKNN